MQVLLVESANVSGLYPFTDTHCTWELRCGAFTIIERWIRAVPSAHVTVASDRDTHVRSFVERSRLRTPFTLRPTVIVGGHVLLSPNTMRSIVQVCSEVSHTTLFFCEDEAVAVWMPNGFSSPADAATLIDKVDVRSVHSIEIPGKVISRLWQCLDLIPDAIMWDSEFLRASGTTNAFIHPSAVLDTSNGPVLVMDEAQVGAMCYVQGPCAIGSGTILKPHTQLLTSAIGPVCRVSGEVSTTIMQGYSNKAHEGFVGHSYLGEWCNLGAGTTTSNLKNNYSHVRVELPTSTEDTNRLMLGTMMGDHVRTAIGTLLNTGTVVGAYTNIVTAGFPPKSVRPFSWYINGTCSVYELKAALQVARAAMARRLVEMDPHTECVAKHLYTEYHG